MTGVETFISILLILLIAAAVTWAGLYVFIAQCKRHYVQEVTQIGDQLREAGDDLNVVEQIANQATPDDPPPYGPLVKDLRQRLQRADESHASCMAQLAALEQAEPPSPLTTAQYLFSVVSQLRLWQQHLQSAKSLGLQIATLQKQVTGAQQQAEQMRTLPLGVAGRVRSVLGASERVTRTCQALQQAGARGDGLDALIAAAKTHNRAIEALPEYFRQGSNDVVMAQATPEITRDVWQKLSNIEKPVYDALRRAQQWQEVYNEAKSMVGAMQVEVAAAERIMGELPPSIDASQHRAKFTELQGNAQDIEALWRSPEVHRLADVSNAATKQMLATQQLATDVMSLHKTHQGFEQALASGGVVMDRIATVLESVARAQTCPVQWNYCAAEFKQLRAIRSSIGEPTEARNPTRLEADLDKALDLGLQAGTLEARVNDVRDHHKQLLAWLSSPEFQTRGDWFHDAASLYVDALVYAPDNWLERDDLASLKADAAALLEREQGLQPLFADQAIPEDEIQTWINRANVYLRERRALQARLDSIDKTLHTVESAEKSAQTEASQVLGALGRLDQGLPQAIGNGPVIKAWNDVIDLWSDGKRLVEALDERTIGKVVDKAANISAWSGECTQGLRILCQAVETEAETVRQDLNGQVEALVAIAPFDSEPAMVTAQQLLDVVPARAIGSKPSKDGAIKDGASKVGASKDTARSMAKDIAGLVEQINRALERHTNLGEALQDLMNRIVTQVDPRVARLDEAHAAAWEKLQELQALQRQIPIIKPLPVVCDEADQLDEAFKQAEAGLEDMSASGRTVKSVVGRLDSLIQQFQYVANQGAGAQADIERDLVRLRSAWDQFSQWTRQLKRFRDWQSSDHALTEAIDKRLTEVDDQIADIQRRYKGRPLPLEFACRELDSLLNATRRDVEVTRDNGIEAIPAQTIQSV